MERTLEVLTMGWYPLTGMPRPGAILSGGNPACPAVHQAQVFSLLCGVQMHSDVFSDGSSQGWPSRNFLILVWSLYPLQVQGRLYGCQR